MSETLTNFLTAPQSSVKAWEGNQTAPFDSQVYSLWETYAQYLFDDQTTFHQWLLAPNPQLKNISPIAVYFSSGNLNEIEELLGRMAYGNIA